MPAIDRRARDTYYAALQGYDRHGTANEQARRLAFSTLLDTAARRACWTLTLRLPLASRTDGPHGRRISLASRQAAAPRDRRIDCGLRVLFLLGIGLPWWHCPHAGADTAPTWRSALPAEQQIARGIVFRHFPCVKRPELHTPAFVIDADLGVPGVHVRVVCGTTTVWDGRTYAACSPVSEWCRHFGAVAAINGGFFGAMRGSRKEVVGLLVTAGVVRSTGRMRGSATDPRSRYARSVFGVTSFGVPRIGWAVAERGGQAILTDYASSREPGSLGYWSAESAVACGPRLAKGGQTLITDRIERLQSPLAVPRSFIAYDVVNGRPRHLVLGVGLRMTYAAAAGFLQEYFRRYHNAACAEAVCLDGGSSSQLTVRSPQGYVDARLTTVKVPTAVLIMANDMARRRLH